MYLTYDEYLTAGGGALDESTFNDLEYRAETLIDWYTFNRLQADTVLPDRVKRCMVTLINLLTAESAAMASPNANGQTTGGVQAGITSQSNDGVSISYNVLSASEINSSMQKKIKECIMLGLQGVVNEAGKKVTWRGIYPDE